MSSRDRDEGEGVIDGLDEASYDRRTVVTGALVGGLVLASPHVAEAARRAIAQPAKNGGILRVGMVGNGTHEVLDPQAQANVIDTATDRVLFDTLARQRANGSLENRLATAFIPNKKATVWTVKLRKGVVWHDGKPFTAKDVAYSFRRIIKQKLPGSGTLSFVDPNHIQVLDKHTVRFHLLTPYVLFPDAAATSVNIIIQDGAASKGFTTKNLIGTGPFKLGEIKPGVRSVFLKNPHYFDHGKPHVDQLIFVIIPDGTARLNALLGGQVDAIEQVDASQVRTIRSHGSTAVLNTPSGHWVPMCMDCTKAPFTDVRVRQAMRLLADRPQIVASALSGFGTVGKDLFGPSDPLYAKSLPQRTQDIEQAKSLLKAAGQSSLTVTLQSADAATGMLSSGLILAQNAKAAGVTIDVIKNPADSYYSQQYMKTPFFMTDWADRPIDPQLGLCLLDGAVYNETQYHSAKLNSLVAQGRRELNKKKQKELYFEAQKLLYNEGGYIIWGFVNLLDGYNKRVHGLHGNPGRNLGFYDFNDVTLS